MVSWLVLGYMYLLLGEMSILTLTLGSGKTARAPCDVSKSPADILRLKGTYRERREDRKQDQFT